MLKELLLSAVASLSSCDGAIESKEESPCPDPSFEESENSQKVAKVLETKLAPESDAFDIAFPEENEEPDDFANGIDSLLNSEPLDPKKGSVSGELYNPGYSVSEAVSSAADSDSEKYYTLSTREKLRYDFDITNPSGYHFEIRRYQRAKMAFVCEATSSFSVELIPATYYIHVFTGNDSKLDTGKYNFQYTTKRISNIAPFNYRGLESQIKMAIWENEIWPCNAPRRGKDDCTVLKYLKTRRGTNAHGKYYGYLDPIFSENWNSEKSEGEEFLESLFFIQNRECQDAAGTFFDHVVETTRKQIKAKSVAKFKSQLIEDGVSLTLRLLGLGPAGSLITLFEQVFNVQKDVNYIASLVKFVFGDQEKQQSYGDEEDYSIDLLEYFSRLATACGSLKDARTTIAAIPRYTSVRKEIIQDSSIAKTHHWTFYSTFLSKYRELNNDYFNYDKDLFENTQTHLGTGMTYQGSISLFSDSSLLSNFVKNESVSVDGKEK